MKEKFSLHQFVISVILTVLQVTAFFFILEAKAISLEHRLTQLETSQEIILIKLGFSK